MSTPPVNLPDSDKFGSLEMDYKELPVRPPPYSPPMTPMPLQPVHSLISDRFSSLAADLDNKELPAPPPPSPEHRALEGCQSIEDFRLPSTTDFTTLRRRSYTTSEAELTRHVVIANHSTLKNSPLRQVASPVDDETTSKRSLSDLKPRLRGSLTPKSTHSRRATLPSPTRRERSSSISSSQGVSKSSTRCIPPAFNMAYIRSTIHAIPITPRTNSSQPRSLPSISPRPPLRGRKISSPIPSHQPSSPTSFSSPRPVTPNSNTSQSQSQSRSHSFSTQSSSLSQSEELVSSFSSDSEADDEAGKGFKTPFSTKKGSLAKRRNHNGSYGRRLSAKTLTFFACGRE